MNSPIALKTPLIDQNIAGLRAGDRVLLSGVIYTARDAAHKRLVDTLRNGRPLPLPLEGQVIYYCGPAPARPGYVIGPAGPTTSSRMDAYTIPLLDAGLKGMIGKGTRNQSIRVAISRFRAIYLVAVGGAAALLSQRITKMDLIAFEDLESEAIYRLEVLDMPLVVAYDISGGNLYQDGIASYQDQEMLP